MSQNKSDILAVVQFLRKHNFKVTISEQIHFSDALEIVYNIFRLLCIVII